MPTSVQPLSISHSFNAGRRTATDRVNAAALDAAFASIAAKINEVIVALNETTRDDDALEDEVVDARCLSNDALEEISALVNAAVTPP